MGCFGGFPLITSDKILKLMEETFCKEIRECKESKTVIFLQNRI